MKTHQKRSIAFRAWLQGREYHKALRAFELVRGLEQGFRKDGTTPKFDHQLTVARLVSMHVASLIYPEDTITAAFLHDVLEDHWQTVSRERLEADFGVRVAHAVWLLSKKTAGMVKDYDVYFGEMAQNPIASVVKLADRIHNVQTMQGVFTIEKQIRYVNEVREHFLPMGKTARRLFPEQYFVYENLSMFLRAQSELIEAMLNEAVKAE